MTQEEKAEAYDKVREKIVLRFGSNVAEEIFSEYEKSEDERIRKALIDIVNARCELYKGITKEMFLAWLEKQGEHVNFLNKIQIGDKVTRNEDGVLVNLSQLERVAKPAEKQGEHDMGISEATKQELEDNLNKALEKETPESCNEFLDEQKPTDKVEPKFKVEKDKWYVCTSQYCNCIEGRNYKATSDGRIIDNYGTEYDMHSDAYKWFRPWTIEDAKDGDVLQANECTLIFDSLTKDVDGNTAVSSWYFCDTKKFYGMGTSKPDLWDIEGVIPATKEQRDLLFQKMHEAGYEWDAEKKELKKIEQKPAKCNNSALKDKLLELFQRFRWYCKDETPTNGDIIEYVDAHIQELIGTMQKPVWSEEDEARFKSCIKILQPSDGYDTINTKWLKSIKNRVQPKQEWSEDDKEMLRRCISATFDHGYLKECDWLKSLKQMNYWKPSDEQMEILQYLCENSLHPNKKVMPTLKSLYQDLKKLRKE